MRGPVSKAGKLRVSFTAKEVADLEEHTFLDPHYFREGVADGKGNTEYAWTRGELEEIVGHIAAAANHCTSPSLEKRLDLIYFRLDALFEAFCKIRLPGEPA